MTTFENNFVLRATLNILLPGIANQLQNLF